MPREKELYRTDTEKGILQESDWKENPSRFQIFARNPPRATFDKLTFA